MEKLNVLFYLDVFKIRKKGTNDILYGDEVNNNVMIEQFVLLTKIQEVWLIELIKLKMRR
jgi:hypothetical protein